MSRDREGTPHTSSGYFVLRAPLLPFRTLVDWADGLEAASAEDGDLERALEADRAKLLARLRSLVHRPEVREALFCASPSLDQAITAWLEDPGSARARGVTSILVRYLARMAGRATPFGLFSSCGVGKVEGEATRLDLGGAEDLVRSTRLDMQYLTALVQVLERDPALRADLVFKPSTALYRIGDRVRCVEATVDGELRTRSFTLSAFDRSPILDAALAAAEGGARAGAIAGAVTKIDPDIDAETARGFVDELIDSQLLVSDLWPPLTGPEPIRHVVHVLSRTRSHSSIVAQLQRVQGKLAGLDERGIRNDVAPYKEVADALASLPAKVDPARLFQVDLVRRPVPARLGAAVVAELERGVRVLHRIATPSVEPDLEAFRDAFRARYETGEVPLCEALDDEVGIGFGETSRVPTGLIDGLRFPNRKAAQPSPTPARDAFLTRRLLELGGAPRWELEERDLKALEATDRVELPGSLAVSASIAARSSEALDRGDFAVAVLGAAAPAPAMLGRFCHADPVLRKAVIEDLEAEDGLAPDVVFAEIAHLPEGRMGNILCRPLLRPWEIPYMGASGAEAEKQIPVQDLLVSVDREGLVRLRSKRLDRWVEPRMTNAHNPQSTSLGVYRLLCALRAQRQPGLGWHWGALGGAPHLPRVTFGRLVLSLESWSLDKGAIEELGRYDGARRFRALSDLRQRLRMPRWVAVVDGVDNLLPVDLENVLACDSLVELIKKRERATLLEVFPGPGDLAATGTDGSYTSEIVVPFRSTRPPAPPRPIRRSSSVARTFGPGSEWLYVKLYAGPDTVDCLLREVVRPSVRRALESGAVRSWFFIRYGDPHFHLRLRFKGDSRRLLTDVLPDLGDALAPWLADGRLHRFTVDTYEREVERYGGDRGIELTEAVFFADSEAVLSVVEGLGGDRDAEVRWRLALAGMHLLLDDHGFELDARLELMRAVRDGFAREHSVDTSFERELGLRFRAVRRELEELLTNGASSDASVRRGLGFLRQRSVEQAPMMRELRALAAGGELTEDLEGVASSHLHMHANRMLAVDHRAQELVLHDYLLRIYEAQSARGRQSG